jgi:nitroreductase
MDTLDLTPDELLTTTRSVRKRLDLERPVAREIVEECIDIALQAPTGSNSQGWQWMVIGDPDLKQGLADLYAKSFDPYIGMPGPEYADGDVRAASRDKVKSSAQHLRDHMHEVPWLVIPLLEGRVPPGSPAWAHAGYWGSILPAAWSFMLALRARGLGSAWTTLHLPDEEAAAELLGIPFERYTQAGLFPVAYTKGTSFKPANRVPAKELIHWDRW